MKKFLRFLVALLLIMLVVGAILSFVVEPTEVVVSRSVIIKAPKETVFQQMSLFHQWPNWSPWYRMDTTAKMEYSGTDGQAGSGYHWIGNDKIGEGTMTDIGVNGNQMDYDLKFMKPHEGSAKGFFKAEDSAGMTRATWSFTMHMGRPMNALLVFMNMDRMLGKDFENGLNNMKTYIESHPANNGDVAVKEVDFPGHVYAGVRKIISWNDLGKFFGDSYSIIGKEMGPKINGAPVGIFYTWDAANKNTDLAAAFPVSDTTAPAKGISFIYLPPSKAYMAVHKGGYMSDAGIHDAIKKYMADKGKTSAFAIEEYVVGMKQEADSNKWVTNIYYIAK